MKLFCCVALLLLPVLIIAEDDPDFFQKPYGTFSDLRFDEQSGDISGVEIRIVPVGEKKFQAAVQIAEGEAGELMVCDVTIEGRSVRFTIDKKYKFAGTFEGTFSIAELEGRLTFSGGRFMKLKLPRAKSFWD